MARILLCSDLDRTLLPNGKHDASPAALQYMRHLGQHPDLSLAYVSGRNLALIKQAINKYQLPAPRYAIADVGSTIYEFSGGEWHPWPFWADEISRDWHNVTHDQLQQLFSDIDSLSLQPDEQQSQHKLSYYTPLQFDRDTVLAEMQQRLDQNKVRASLVWSVDEPAAQGLLDVLPARANKLGAIRFLMSRVGFSDQHVVFAGDSGNDLAVLKSGLRSILVKNADRAVYKEAIAALQAQGCAEQLYLARGGLYGLNGNYSAGVIEGLIHFEPKFKAWLQTMVAETK